MNRTILKVILLFFLGLTPLLYYIIKSYLPVYQSKPYLYELLYIVPFILLILSAILGLRINQTRIFFIAILWLMIYFIIGYPSLFSLNKNNIYQFSKIISLLLPFIVMLLFFLKEDHLFGSCGLIRSLSIIVFFVLSIWISTSTPVFLNKFGVFNQLIRFENWVLPDLMWFPFAGIIVLFFMSNMNEMGIVPFKVVVAISFIPIFIVLNTISVNLMNPEIRTFNAISFIMIGVFSLYAVYRIYWQKAYIDELTGIPNRRAFNEQLKKLGKKYLIAMIDIDHFKRFNDTYGHSEGDNVLRFIANHINKGTKGNVFRYGGEEFSAIFKRAKLNDIYWHLDRMRQKLALKNFYIRTSEKIRKNKSEQDRGKRLNMTKKVKLTISIGIAQKTNKAKNVEDVIKKADKALYDAKSKGRNRCSKARG